MRVLHTILSKGLAGTERYVTDLCNHQIKHHQVAILVRYDHHLENNLTFLSWLSPDVRVLKVPKQLPLPWMMRHIHYWKPDIIHSHHKRDAKYIGTYFRHLPKVGTLHIEYQAAFRNFDGLICIANWQRDGIPDDYSGLSINISNWLPMIEKERHHSTAHDLRVMLGIPEDGYVVGGVGRFSKEKGFDVLVDAFLQADLPNSYLVIVGDGPERQRLEKRCNDGRIILPGRTSDILPYYVLFDLFVLSSIFEPFGLVLLEAMSAGLPIVSTRVDGPLEILSDEEVILVEPEDAQLMAAALSAVYAKNLRKPINYNLSRFSIGRQAGEIEGIYRQLIHEN